MKHFKTALLACLLPACALAQPGYWGVGYISNPPPDMSPHGFIYRMGAQGDSLELVHEFSLTDGSGAGPARLVAAANGKLYGSSIIGGEHGVGLLFEYDPETDVYRVVHHFSDGDPNILYANPDMGVGLTEVSPGVLYGQVKHTYIIPAPAGRIFSYHTETENIVPVTNVPGFTGGPWNDAQKNYIKNGFFKASNGFLFTAGARNSTCPGGQPDNGSLFRLNPSNGTMTTVYLNPCNSADGRQYNAPQFEVEGVLIGTAGGGAGVAYPSNMNGFGVLYGFDIQTQAYTKLYGFQGAPDDGEDPFPELFPGSDGRWYGATERGGIHDRGTLFAYDPQNGEVEIVYVFENVHPSNQIGPYGRLQMAASNGKLYGSTSTGIFEFDPATQTMRKVVDIPRFQSGEMVETCRKPAYQPADQTNFTLCSGTPFAFNSGGKYYESATWWKDGVIAPGQNSPALKFDSIAVEDAGLWQLELANECGSTFPPPVQIAVNPAGEDVVNPEIFPTGNHDLCPGDSLLLEGNFGGTWNTGADSYGIWVDEPGAYQTVNTYACGTVYSNVIAVDTLHRPIPEIHVTASFFCPGDSVTLYGNMEGQWNIGVWGSAITVPVEAYHQYALFVPWTCGTEISNWFWIQPGQIAHEEPHPEIANAASAVLCPGGSLVLESNNPQIPGSTYWWRWGKIGPDGDIEYLGSGLTQNVNEPGDYVLAQRNPCGAYRYSDTLTVTLGPEPPSVPSIFASMGTFHICPGDTLVLSTDAQNPTWNTGHIGPELTVFSSGIYWVTDENTCGSVSSEIIEVIVSTNAGTVSVGWEDYPQAICENTAPLPLGGGWPEGGAYFGPGVVGGIFDPAFAGGGVHTLGYTYANEFGCTGTIEIEVAIDSLPHAPLNVLAVLDNVLTPGVAHDACAGDENYLMPIPILPGVWSDGDTTAFKTVQESGTYSYRYANTCGLGLWSEAIEVTVHDHVETEQFLAICPGDSATVGGVHYTLPGTYTDTLVAVVGCDSIITTHLELHEIDLNLEVAVSETGLVAEEQMATYRWLECATGFTPIPGATQPVFQPEVGGVYAVEVTSLECTSVVDTSACIAHAGTVSLVAAAADLGLRVFPNPTEGKVTVSAGETILLLEVYDPWGRQVYRRSVHAGEVTLDMSSHASGVYYLRIVGKFGVRVERILVERD